MDYIGIDLHKRDSQICIRGAEGELSEPRVRTTPASFADVLGDRSDRSSHRRVREQRAGPVAPRTRRALE